MIKIQLIVIEVINSETFYVLTLAKICVDNLTIIGLIEDKFGRMGLNVFLAANFTNYSSSMTTIYKSLKRWRRPLQTIH